VPVQVGVEKRCGSCRATLPLAAFNKDRSHKDGLDSRCRECRRIENRDYYLRKRNDPTFQARRKEILTQWRKKDPERYKAQYTRNRRQHPERYQNLHLRRYYGITLDQYRELERAQAGGCAICGARPKGQALAVDHDHVTGAIRGLLCRSCNSGIGHLGDDPARVRAALAYLERQR
jgi:hypothetical protein